MFSALNINQIQSGINSTNDFLDQVSKKYKGHIKKLSLFIQVATKTEALITHLFSETLLKELSHVAYFQEIKGVSVHVFRGALSLAVKARDVIAFVSMRTLKRKLIKHIENVRSSYSEGNVDFFTTSVIKVLSTVGAIFGAPKATANFLNVFDIIVPSKWLDKLLVPNLISLALAPTKILTKVRACMSTKALLNELTQKKYRAFLKAYGKKSEALRELSVTELRAKVQKKKQKLIKDPCFLEEVQHKANQGFARALNKKIQENPRILDKIFKISFENTGGINFFEALVKEEMQNISNAENLKSAVKAIQSHLQHRIYTNYFGIFAKTVLFGSGLIGQLETLGIPLNPVSPIKNTMEGILTILSIANFFYQGKKRGVFVTAMKNATKNLV
ncbi:MAG: hypothetical protein ACXWM7_04115 [Parachlamydiaceae bacterium]